jgi:flagellar protein FliS
VVNNEKEVAQLYKKKQIESASPGQLILLLYDGAIDYLNRAEAALAEDQFSRIDKFHQNIIYCQNILGELMASLDFDSGGDIAQNLFRLYEYMRYRLITTNITKGHEVIAELKSLLSGLRDSWVQAIEQEMKQPVRSPMPLPAQKGGLNIQG